MLAAMRIVQATTPEEISTVRALMREYQQALGVDLCFQNFEAELARLPGSYAPPNGRLLLATEGEIAVGCVALQPTTADRCEMKRLYVRPSARGTGLGRSLVTRLLEEAVSIGYREIVLDTLPSMTEAQQLYERFGFAETTAYRPNPIDGTRYLAKQLR